MAEKPIQLTDAQLDVLHRAIDGTADYCVEWELRQAIRAAVEEIKTLRAERDALKGWVQRTADSTELRTKRAGYHARRVALEAAHVLEAGGSHDPE